MPSIQNLDKRFPIVNPDGTPTDYLIRLLNDRGISQQEDEENLLDKADKTTQIIAGTGLSGGGDLSADRTIDLNATFDDLTDVDMTSTPPTAGQVPVWDAVNSLWKPGAGGGGSGGLTKLYQMTAPVSGVYDFGGSLTLSGYSKILVVMEGMQVSAVARPFVRFYVGGSIVNSGTQYKYRAVAGASGNFANTVNGNGNNEIQLMVTDNNWSIGSGASDNFNGEITLWDADSSIHKIMRWDGAVTQSATTQMINYYGHGSLRNTGALTGIYIGLNTGNFTAGTVTIYGLAR